MIKFENTEVVGWEHAIRGMRNPMNSWEKSDSQMMWTEDPSYHDIGRPDLAMNMIIGPNDHSLMMKLRNAGTDHRKFMRMITVYVDITAPLYWWKEFDTYKVGTVANSCSTMHKIHEKEFTIDDFSCEHVSDDIFDKDICVEFDDGDLTPIGVLETTIDSLNLCRKKYLQTKDKKYWWQMIQLLPSSYNQKRTVMLNYEVLANIYKSRKFHKLDEWSWHQEMLYATTLEDGKRESIKGQYGFCDWIEELPYSELITGED